MTNDIEIPDNEELRSLVCLRDLFNERNEYCWAAMIDSAARRIRADAEEIKRLERQCSRLKAVADCESRNVEALMAERGDKTDPLTRIAAALERPSREWVAVALTIRSAILAGNTLTKLNGAGALGAADALLAEMGEK